jgi:hypothetical protein
MENRSAPAGRPRFDIGDIVRQHRAAFEAQFPSTPAQRRVLSAIAQCRTAALGGHIDVCRSCGHEHPSYNSCRNRHCPKCQALAQQRWIDARSDRLLPVKHFHVVFTLPSELRSLAQYRSCEIYTALMSAVSQTLLELGQSHFGGQLGITLVLHTWTRDLRFHPHVHAIVTAGALTPARTHWVPSNPTFLFPVKVMGALLRGKMIAKLRALQQRGVMDGLSTPCEAAAFEQLIARLARLDWVVYAKKPFGTAYHVLAYLGRYTHRVAIANSRLIDVSDDAVTFRTKDGKTVTLPPVTFIARLVQHVLPQGFHKIRHGGLYAAASVRPNGSLNAARQRLATATTTPVIQTAPPALLIPDSLKESTADPEAMCPRCGRPMDRILVPRSRAPP